MAYEPHYPFPPARAYRLNRVLFLLKSDPAFLQRYVEDPPGALEGQGLTDAERAAVLALERDRLVALGAHAYLVFMADLRVRGARGQMTYEYF